MEITASIENCASICTCKCLTLMVFQWHRCWWLVVLNWSQTSRVISILVSHEGIYYISSRSSITMKKWLLGILSIIWVRNEKRGIKKESFSSLLLRQVYLIFSRRNIVMHIYMMIIRRSLYYHIADGTYVIQYIHSFFRAF